MKKNVFVAHSVTYNQGLYLGQAQAIPIFRNDPLVEDVAFHMHCADVLTGPTGSQYWKADGMQVSKDDIEKANKMKNCGYDLAPELDRLLLSTPAGTYTTRPDLDSHVSGIHRSNNLIGPKDLLEAHHTPRKAVEMYKFFNEQCASRVVPIKPILAVEVQDTAMARFDPVNKRGMMLRKLDFPVIYQAIQDIYPLKDGEILCDEDVDLLRTRAAYELMQLLEGATLYVTWDTPDSELGCWNQQLDVLLDEEFYDDRGPDSGWQKPAYARLEGLEVNDLLTADYRILDIVEPEFKAPLLV